MDSSNPQDPRPESGNQGGAQAELRREWKFSQGGCTSGVEDGHFSDQDEEESHDKQVCRRRREEECERLGVSPVSLMCVISCH